MRVRGRRWRPAGLNRPGTSIALCEPGGNCWLLVVLGYIFCDVHRRFSLLTEVRYPNASDCTKTDARRNGPCLALERPSSSV